MVLIVVSNLRRKKPHDDDIWRFDIFTHVISQHIQWSVVAVRFLFKSIPEVMLSNEMPCAWVKTSSEEAAHNQIDKRSRSVIRDQDVIEDDL